MVQVLPEVPSFGTTFARNFGQGLSQGLEKSTDFATKMALEKEKRITKEKEEKRTLDQTFTPILEEMRSLSGAVGPIVSKMDIVNPWSEGAGTRSKINNLRLSLEGLFRDLTLKGQFPKAIYERILKELPSASDTPEQYENKIQAVESILKAQGGQKEKEGATPKKGRVKFSKEHPEHRKKAEQLYKTYKDKNKVREELSKEFDF